MEVRTRIDVFEDIFLVFLALGALVGIVVVSYTLYNAYKYRDTDERPDDEDLPTVGELPTGGKGGKKLFLSFGLSAIIVISLVVWTYGMLLYVEDGPDMDPEDAIEIEVEGQAFSWNYEYENGLEPGHLVVPADTPVWLEVTSIDVWHSYGITDLRVKADAIPGEYDETWFMADEPGDYRAECFELCGFGHSGMDDDVEVMSQDSYEEWLDEQFTLTIDLEDAAEEPFTDGFELELAHVENDEFEDDLSGTYTEESDEFENGTLEITEFRQGGDYDLVITPEDGDLEPVEDTIDFTSATSESYTLEDPDAAEEEEDDEEENDEDDEETDDESDTEEGDDE
ncbi:cytochrome c oxidase subunit II [Natronolimnobius baerhuensis]|uniref:Cytochrome c oxidase subunit II n=1 Tax=Natronolimnobius baerhuensis TaxID=253108 RepID=A0A202EAD2_9EURY|nr:cytochrome c oxidase subunit II [Natronolimnobius baerhuensis]OVE85187.1 cytochrome c oxidase subunit II [Natronolimnobius baerhuensis]